MQYFLKEICGLSGTIILYVIVLITGKFQKVLNIQIFFNLLCYSEWIHSKNSFSFKLFVLHMQSLTFCQPEVLLIIYEYLDVPLPGYPVMNIPYPIILPTMKGRVNAGKHLISMWKPFTGVNKEEN